MSPSFTHDPIAFAADLRARGVHPRDIAAAVDAGEIMRAAPGVYVTPETWVDQDLESALACHRTGGVVALLTAAARHGLCDAVPGTIELIVPWSEIRRPPAGMPVTAYRTRDEQALLLGVEVHRFHQLTWMMTDTARTIVDLYRIDPAAHRQHGVASLATYLRDDGDEGKLREYAQAFDAWDRIGPEVEAINESYSRGMRP